MNFTLQKLSLIVVFLFAGSSVFSTFAQLNGDGDGFVQGQFVEIGIDAQCGVLGGTTFLGPPTTGSDYGAYHPTNTSIGFTANPAMDGWATQCGDYFLPGGPFAGWAVAGGGTFFQNNDRDGACGVAGTLTATQPSANGGVGEIVWTGTTTNGLQITQTYTVGASDLYFTNTVEICNTTGATITGVSYGLGFDPDNDQPQGGGFATTNTIVTQGGSGTFGTGGTTAEITAVGGGAGCFLSLHSGCSDNDGDGQRDDNAYVGTLFSFDVPDPSTLISTTGTGWDDTNEGFSELADQAFGIAYDLGDLAPGACAQAIVVFELSPGAAPDPQLEYTGDVDPATAGEQLCNNTPTNPPIVSGFPGVGTFQFTNGSTTAPDGIATIDPTTGVISDGVANTTYTAEYFYDANSNGILDGCNDTSADFMVDFVLCCDEPVISVAPSDTEACEGDPAVALTFSEDTPGSGTIDTYTWTGDTGPLSATNVASPTFATTTPGRYILDLDVTTDDGCSTSTTVKVDIVGLPAAPTVTDDLICQGDTPNGLVANCAACPDIPAATGSNTITVDIPGTEFGGQPGGANVVFSMSYDMAFAGVPSGATVTGVSYSEVSGMAFDVDGGGPCLGSWASEAVIEITSPDSNTSGQIADPGAANAPGDWTIAAGSSTALNGDNASGLWTIDLFDNYDDIALCAGASATMHEQDVMTQTLTLTVDWELAATPVTSTTTWWDAATGGTQQGTGGTLDPTGLTAEEGAVDLNADGTYTFYAQCECNGCAGPREAVVLTVDPVAVADAGADQAVCQGEVVDLVGTITGGNLGTGTWSGGAGAFGSTTALTTTYTPAASEAGTNVTLTLTPDEPGTCTTTDNIIIFIEATPAAPSPVAGDELCEQDETTNPIAPAPSLSATCPACPDTPGATGSNTITVAIPGTQFGGQVDQSNVVFSMSYDMAAAGIPAGATVTNVAYSSINGEAYFVEGNVFCTGSWANEAVIEITSPDATPSGQINDPLAPTTPGTWAIPTGALTSFNGENASGVWIIDLFDNFDDIANCAVPSGSLITSHEQDVYSTEITLTVDWETAATPATGAVTWWDASTGGTQQGTGATFDPTGTTAEEGALDFNAPGDYTYYVQCECNGCPSTREAVVLTVIDTPNPPANPAIPAFCQDLAPYPNIDPGTGVYNFYRDGTLIAGAGESVGSYTLTAADDETNITVTEIVTGPDGTECESLASVPAAIEILDPITFTPVVDCANVGADSYRVTFTVARGTDGADDTFEIIAPGSTAITPSATVTDGTSVSIDFPLGAGWSITVQNSGAGTPDLCPVTLTGDQVSCCPAATADAALQNLCDGELPDLSVAASFSAGINDINGQLNTTDVASGMDNAADGVVWFTVATGDPAPDPMTATPYTDGDMLPIDNCIQGEFTLYAFLQCDKDGDMSSFDPVGAAGLYDDEWIAAGSIDVAVYPEITATIALPDLPLECRVELTPSCMNFLVEATFDDVAFGTTVSQSIDGLPTVENTGTSYIFDPDEVFAPAASVGEVNFVITNTIAPADMGTTCISIPAGPQDYKCCIAEAGFPATTPICPDVYDADGNLETAGEPMTVTVTGYEDFNLYSTYLIVTDDAGMILEVIDLSDDLTWPATFTSVPAATALNQSATPTVPVGINSQATFEFAYEHWTLAPYNLAPDFGPCADGNPGLDVRFYSYNDFDFKQPDPLPQSMDGLTMVPDIQNAGNTYTSDIAMVGMNDDICHDLSVADDQYVPSPITFAGMGPNTLEGVTGSTSPFYYNTHEISICGGTLPYDFEWEETGYVRHSITQPGLIRIIYADDAEWSVTATDANNCSGGFLVFSNDDMNGDGTMDLILDIESYTVVGDNPFTPTAEGTIDVVVTGGDCGGAYSYDWTGPASWDGTGNGTASISNCVSGWYSLTVTCGDQTTSGWYWVTRVTPGGRSKDAASMLKASPNPFSDMAVVNFSVSETAHVDLGLFSVNGQRVVNLFSGKAEAGDVYGVDVVSENLAAGVYLLQLTGDNGLIEHEQVIITK